MNQTTAMAKREKEQRREHREPEYILPVVNITETENEYLLEAEMPGVNKQGLEVLLEGSQLTLIGHRQQPELDGAELVYRESVPSDYRRTFMLDPAIDTQKIEAKMENGILRLTLPKTAEVRPRRIEITG